MPLETVRAFLSSPYGQTAEAQVYWEIVESAIRRVAKAVERPKLMIKSARTEAEGLTVKENIKRVIDECDLIIAIITGNNPNVFWEIGYGEAQGKPVVYLLDEKESPRDSPILVSEALMCLYRSESLAAKKLPREVEDKLKSSVEVAIQTAIATKRPRVAVYSNREDCGLPRLVSDASSRIHLITTTLAYFADFQRFVFPQNSGRYAFDSPIERGVEVKVLLLDPESPMVKYRAAQLGLEHDVRAFRQELRESARQFYKRYKNKSNCTIRVYDDLPLQITLVVDNQVVTSVLTRGSRGRRNLHFALDMTLPGANESFEKHFFEVNAAPSNDVSAYKWAN